ncbi:hypothetical protein LMG7143_01121 [Ralstonia thomasii]|jgi:hypothetical protein|uniref:hypothetical protein n=1 Tax=Ralstonia thomasii TaxID=3058596 RepID=UPI0028F5AA2E|nr:hypothetical protein [Ralstonia sp. LMG 18095]CAJ0709541.1 hypothetical protein LMG7143_01111 [Ralstonia sp. LMG 18095]CAJ0709562.1 hypothetical protein LMG7143_01121 [Ralstonia sp. LMG 18095]
MRTILPLLVCIAIPTAAAQTVNTCKINGKTVITDKPCDRAMEATMEFGTPAERAAKQQREEQRKSNCLSLAKSRASLVQTMNSPGGAFMVEMIKNNLRTLDEQMAVNHC